MYVTHVVSRLKGRYIGRCISWTMWLLWGHGRKKQHHIYYDMYNMNKEIDAEINCCTRRYILVFPSYIHAGTDKSKCGHTAAVVVFGGVVIHLHLVIMLLLSLCGASCAYISVFSFFMPPPPLLLLSLVPSHTNSIRWLLVASCQSVSVVCHLASTTAVLAREQSPVLKQQTNSVLGVKTAVSGTSSGYCCSTCSSSVGAGHGLRHLPEYTLCG